MTGPVRRTERVWRIAAAAAITLLAACCGGPTPSASVPPSPTARPAPTITGSPAPDSLHVDGLATVNVDNLTQVADPADLSGSAGQGTRLATFDTGQLLFLVAGPNEAGGDAYWEVADRAHPDNQQQFGWVPAVRGFTPTLVPFVPVCPELDQLTAQALADLGDLQSLACFGATELTVQGELACHQMTINANIGGASFMDDSRVCTLDGVLPVYGRVATAILDIDPRPAVVRGTYQLTGHFDDPGAHSCGYIPLGFSIEVPRAGDPWPVLDCRTDFVVTFVEPAE